ncbi:MAG: Gfo/Idh/MocA family oxidoreductase [Phycisphaerales bacterium]|jgi:predicted dehydrogenase|nr:Gfo/Idh/MocA family oxidoreductase [Phycisphaerales bacterium]
MAESLRIGLIGLDTSHAPAFARLFNVETDPEHLPGGKVVTAYPGGSKDFELSWSRVGKFTDEIREKFGVTMVDSPEAVAEASDLVLMTAVDGRAHRALFERIVKYKRPTFIDKPFATTSEDAKAIFKLAQANGVTVMSCSSLRYADSLTDALNDPKAQELGKVVGCDVYGPMDIQPPLPGLFWYGIHSVEIMSYVMGLGCREVRVATSEKFDLITGVWNDGRMASVRGNRNENYSYGVTLQREKGAQYVNMSNNKRSYYYNMLKAIMGTLPKGKSEVPAEETLQVVRFLEAANESKSSGKPVVL